MRNATTVIFPLQLLLYHFHHSMLSAILSTLLLVTAEAKFGRHSFPSVTHDGKQTANEFQMIVSENIVDGRTNLRGADTYTISSIYPLLIENDDVVTVKYSSSKPNESDWIGAFSPSYVDVTQTSAVKYGFCDDDLNYLSSGSGALTFNFTNLRADIKFYFFTNGTKYPILMGHSDSLVTFKNNNQPLRPRVVPTGDYDVFNLLWSSATSTKPTLKWGLSAGVYNNIVSAATTSIPKSEVCGSPANTTGWRDLGLIHTASFVGMKAAANQKVYYIFGDEATSDFSKEHVLNVPPLPGTQPPNRPTTAILYDDLGRGSMDMTYTWYEYGRPSIYTAMSVGAEVAAGNIDAIYHGGDISYATGYIAVWDFYLDMMAPVASGTVYLTTVGNHESDWYNSASMYSNADSGGECGVMTTKLIPMPAPATTDAPWWSYDVGLIHFIGISSEHNYSIGSEQYRWLERDLESIDRKVTPWVIFGAHRAMYLNSNYSGTITSDVYVSELMIANLEHLLWKHRVNIGFYGHNHVVQRHSAVLKHVVIQRSEERRDGEGNIVHYHEDPQATVHWVVGTGGASFTKTAMDPKPLWNEMFFYEYGYAKVTAVNASYLAWDWIKSETNEVLDRMVITQKDPTTSWKI